MIRIKIVFDSLCRRRRFIEKCTFIYKTTFLRNIFSTTFVVFYSTASSDCKVFVFLDVRLIHILPVQFLNWHDKHFFPVLCAVVFISDFFYFILFFLSFAQACGMPQSI